MSPGAAEARPRALPWPGLLAAGLVSAVAARGWIDPAWLWIASPPWLLFGFLPLLARWSPVEPSAVKLALLSALVSPFLAAALFTGARFAGAASADALALTAAAVGLLALLGVGRRMTLVQPGRAAWAALLLSALLALAAAALGPLAEGAAARLAAGGVWTSGVVYALDAGLPPEGPWSAGRALEGPLVWEALGALVARALGTDPARALGLVRCIGAAAFPLGVYLLAAPVWRRAKHDVLSVLLAVFAWGAGFAWWRVPGAEDTVALEDAGPRTQALRNLGAALGDPEPLAGLTELTRPGPFLLALALAVGAWACAAHALRHAQRPWPGLCALLHGLAFLVHPYAGASAAVATGLAALLFAPVRDVRARVPLLVGAAVLAAALVRGVTVPAAEAGAGDALGRTLATFALGAGGALVLLPLAWSRARDEDRDAEGRVLRALLVLSTLTPLVVALLPTASAWQRVELLRLASVPLGVLAAGAFFRAWSLGGARRAAAGAWLLVVAAGAGVTTWEGIAGTWRLSRGELPVGLVPGLATGGLPRYEARGGADPLEQVWRWLRDELPERAAGAALVFDTSTLDDGLALGDNPHPAPLYTGLPAWCDEALRGRVEDGRHAARLDSVRRLYHQPTAHGVELTRELDQLGRPCIVVADVATLLRGEAFEHKLRRLGFELLAEVPGARLHFRPAGGER